MDNSSVGKALTVALVVCVALTGVIVTNVRLENRKTSNDGSPSVSMQQSNAAHTQTKPTE